MSFDLGWERKKIEVIIRFFVLGRWEDGMICFGGCYCFSVIRVVFVSFLGGLVDVFGVSG